MTRGAGVAGGAACWWLGGKAEKAPAARPEPKVFAGRCGAKRTCGEMASCEEARFYLTQCGLSRLDGDLDGTPCEAVCR